MRNQIPVTCPTCGGVGRCPDVDAVGHPVPRRFVKGDYPFIQYTMRQGWAREVWLKGKVETFQKPDFPCAPNYVRIDLPGKLCPRCEGGNSCPQCGFTGTILVSG